MLTATLEHPTELTLGVIDVEKLPLAPKPQDKPQPILRFELLFGRHEERNPRWKPTHKRKDTATGVLIPIMLNSDGDEVPENLMYVKGDIIETTADLLRAIDHNSGPNGAKKFRRVIGDPIGDMRKVQEAVKADPVPGTPKETQWTVDKLNAKSIRDLQLICSNAKIAYDREDRKDRLIALIIGESK